jgi:hypothetical protein
MFLRPDGGPSKDEIYDTQSFANARDFMRISHPRGRSGGRSLHSDDIEEDQTRSDSPVPFDGVQKQVRRKVLFHGGTMDENNKGPALEQSIDSKDSRRTSRPVVRVAKEETRSSSDLASKTLAGEFEHQGRDNLGSSVAKPIKPFAGVGGMKAGEDIQRVSYMLFRIIHQYKVTSMVDVPCRAHAHWMHLFLDHAEKEIPKFQYYCVDTNRKVLKAVKKQKHPLPNRQFVLKQFWREALPEADIVFSWGGLENMKEENVYKFLKLVASSKKHKYILIGSHTEGSRVVRKSMKGQKLLPKPMNIRKAPFSLHKPMRVISELSVNGVKKQLYMYKPENMRSEWV